MKERKQTRGPLDELRLAYTSLLPAERAVVRDVLRELALAMDAEQGLECNLAGITAIELKK